MTDLYTRPVHYIIYQSLMKFTAQNRLQRNFAHEYTYNTRWINVSSCDVFENKHAATACRKDELLFHLSLASLDLYLNLFEAV